MFWWSAFLVGFLGSFHCVGMCGPIALSLPAGDSGRARFLFGRFLYNGGRVVTYSVLGMLAGLIGHSFAMAGFQKSLSIAAGILILLMIALPYLLKRKLSAETVLYKYTSLIRNSFRTLFGRKGNITLFFIGMVNGLLPCGFVYIALAGAAASALATSGLLYMALFGLGTLPMMFMLSVAGRFLSPGMQQTIRRLTPVVAVTVAFLLIYRGITLEPAACCRHH